MTFGVFFLELCSTQIFCIDKRVVGGLVFYKYISTLNTYLSRYVRKRSFGDMRPVKILVRLHGLHYENMPSQIY